MKVNKKNNRELLISQRNMNSNREKKNGNNKRKNQSWNSAYFVQKEQAGEAERKNKRKFIHKVTILNRKYETLPFFFFFFFFFHVLVFFFFSKKKILHPKVLLSREVPRPTPRIKTVQYQISYSNSYNRRKP